MSHRNNLARIKAVYNALGPLRDSVVFVGGATVSLYVDRMAEETRPTDDVDIVVELWAYKDYAAIEEQLRKMGFENDQESGVICRYKIHGIVVDVMPTGENVLNFSNRWYPDGFLSAIHYSIDKEHIIKIFAVPYFIASKIEAFKSRGANDGRTSTDFEDIVYLLENRRMIWDDMKNAPQEIKKYLIKEFALLLKNPFIEEWVNAHAGYGSPPATSFILTQLELFTNPEEDGW